MKKILFILLFAALCIPTPVLAEDETPPPDPNSYEVLCEVAGGCVTVEDEPKPVNQEDIPCGEAFSIHMCQESGEEDERKPYTEEEGKREEEPQPLEEDVSVRGPTLLEMYPDADFWFE